MLVISTREFREKQKMYLDLVDQKEQVILQRGKNKAYILTPISKEDRILANPEVKDRIMHSLEQAKKGNLITLPKEDIDELLGL
jgi:antitoxin YefM